MHPVGMLVTDCPLSPDLRRSHAGLDSNRRLLALTGTSSTGLLAGESASRAKHLKHKRLASSL
jgi:hypothetical protein